MRVHGEGAGACPRRMRGKAPAHQLIAGHCVNVWVIAHGHLGSALKVFRHPLPPAHLPNLAPTLDLNWEASASRTAWATTAPWYISNRISYLDITTIHNDSKTRWWRQKYQRFLSKCGGGLHPCSISLNLHLSLDFDTPLLQSSVFYFTTALGWINVAGIWFKALIMWGILHQSCCLLQPAPSGFNIWHVFVLPSHTRVPCGCRCWTISGLNGFSPPGNLAIHSPGKVEAERQVFRTIISLGWPNSALANVLFISNPLRFSCMF